MRFWILILTLGLLSFRSEDPGFLKKQLGHSRVKAAFDRKWPDLEARLRSMDLDPDSTHILIRAFKFEEDVELWVRDRDSLPFQLLASYKFCSNVGALGPKRKQGDLQIPEGLYTLSQFNPESNFHLSLKVDYPNRSDSLLGHTPQLGGLIFIHGGCSTIGCIPITDEKIEELYVMAVKARHNGQEQIPIQLFPVRLSEENLNSLNDLQGRISSANLELWNNLMPAYRHFETEGVPLSYHIDSISGRYVYP